MKKFKLLSSLLAFVLSISMLIQPAFAIVPQTLAIAKQDIAGVPNCIPVSVLNYGAKGDGITNDTTAIQNAINAAAGGQTVLFPAGHTYVITTLSIPSNTVISGYGATLLMIDTGLTPGPWPHESTNFDPAGIQTQTGSSNISIYGLTINGGYNSASPRVNYRCPIMIFDTTQVKVVDCTAFNFEGYGMAAYSNGTYSWPSGQTFSPWTATFNTSDVIFERDYVYDGHTDTPNIVPWQFLTMYAENIKFIDCCSENGEDSLFRAQNSNHILFSGCKAANNLIKDYGTWDGQPFDIYKSADVTMDNCYAENVGSNTDQTGYFIYQVDHVKLINSTGRVDGEVFRLKPADDKYAINDVEVSNCTLLGVVNVQANLISDLNISNNNIAGFIWTQGLSRTDPISTSNLLISGNTLMPAETNISAYSISYDAFLKWIKTSPPDAIATTRLCAAITETSN